MMPGLLDSIADLDVLATLRLWGEKIDRLTRAIERLASAIEDDAA